MTSPIFPNVSTISFWDNYAKWYQFWLEHNQYYQKIIDLLASIIKPGWKVLDIGAGSGILSFPIRRMGCEVIALEPSTVMRSLLYEKALSLLDGGFEGITLRAERWEESSLNGYQGMDLIVACNSLHLTEIGFEAALQKIFQSAPNHLLLITEYCRDRALTWTQGQYQKRFTEVYNIESSFAYHHIDEAIEHRSFKQNKMLSADQIMHLKEQLVFHDDHLWLKDSACVAVSWWQKNGQEEPAMSIFNKPWSDQEAMASGRSETLRSPSPYH